MWIQVDSDNAELSHNRSVTCYPTIVKYHKVQIIVKKLKDKQWSGTDTIRSHILPSNP